MMVEGIGKMGTYRIWGNDVAALAETPSDRINEPEADGPDTTKSIGTENSCVNGSSV